ncbi:F1F0 ATP synthase subunit f [Ascoidea rubescens DSM 1968]|uniref:Putative ATP synthase f chain mitochondrial n=1 Tax=Ascoidea rubescens DSM 1968 TaxID=1344418 RepID=A0A1D2VKS5_9ASCO|nr:putative ATP synthase f chain mitochondrial precursor [Ascoidea rubescens DSM 1968]ODV62202.1 putative ATP synthase f chain mitochondrial precursor [Ascoidea rubescens DSM 1968]
MSFVARRQLSTLIPPKIVSVKNLGSNPNAKKMASVVEFYKALPQGDAPVKKSWGLLSKYRSAYFDGENGSVKPLLHYALFIMGVGYSLEYYFHHAAHNGEHH